MLGARRISRLTYLDSPGAKIVNQEPWMSLSRRSLSRNAAATARLAGGVPCALMATPSLLSWTKKSFHWPLPVKPLMVSTPRQTDAKQPSDATCCTRFTEQQNAVDRAFSTYGNNSVVKQRKLTVRPMKCIVTSFFDALSPHSFTIS